MPSLSVGIRPDEQLLDTIIAKYKHLDSAGAEKQSAGRPSGLEPPMSRSASQEERIFPTTSGSPRTSHATASERHEAAPPLGKEEREIEELNERLNDMLHSLSKDRITGGRDTPEEGDFKLLHLRPEPEDPTQEIRHRSLEMLAQNAKTGLHAMER